MTDAPETRTLTRLFTHQAIGRYLALCLSFAGVAITSRYLGVGDFGRLAAAQALISLVYTFTDFGVNSVVVLRHGRGARMESSIQDSLALSVVSFPPLAAVAAVLAYTASGGDSRIQELTLVLIPYLLLMSVGFAFQPIFQIQEQYSGSALAEVAAAAISLAGTVAASGVHAHLWVFAFVIDSSAAARLLILWVFARRLCQLSLHLDVSRLRALLIEAAPLGAAAIIGIIYLRIDMVLLTNLSTPDQVGIYGVAYRVLGLVATVPALVGSSAIARLSRASVLGSLSDLQEGVRASLAVVGFWVLPAVLGGALLAPQIMVFIGGRSYGSGGPVLVLLLVSALITAFNLCVGAALIAQGRKRTLIGLGLLSLIPNVALNVWLIPRFGALGGGGVLVASEGIALLAAGYACREALSRGVLVDLIRLVPGLAAIVLGTSLTQDWSLIPRALIAGSLFITVFLVQKRVTVKDV